jgi:hypothetical protein
MDIKLRDQETVLGLTGHLLDQIEAVGLACSISVKARIFGFAFLALNYFFQQMWRSWEATARVGERKTYEPTGESIWDAYWQTILFGDHGCDQEEKERVRAECDAFYAAFRKPYSSAERWRFYWIRHLWAIYYFVIVLIRVGLEARGKYKRGCGLAFTTRCTQMGGRRLIRTQAGYIGLAVHSGEVGDYIALFKGARMPFVVRSEPDGWRLIGDSYVHGVMHGESWQVDRCRTFWIH